LFSHGLFPPNLGTLSNVVALAGSQCPYASLKLDVFCKMERTVKQKCTMKLGPDERKC